MVNKNNIHIGQLIKAELKKQGKTNIWFAQQLSVNIRTVNKIFLKEVIDTHQLLRISKILHKDFFQYYSDDIKDSCSPF